MNLIWHMASGGGLGQIYRKIGDLSFSQHCKAKIRFKFQYIDITIHSPAIASKPRSKNCLKPNAWLIVLKKRLHPRTCASHRKPSPGGIGFMAHLFQRCRVFGMKGRFGETLGKWMIMGLSARRNKRLNLCRGVCGKVAFTRYPASQSLRSR
jgi:hypothetical protein